MRASGLDRPLLVTTGALAIVGIAVLYSAGQTDVPTAASGIWERQALWLVVGGVCAVLVYRVSPRLIEWVAPVVYGLAILLLALTLLFGTGVGTATGSKSWITVFGVRLGQ